MNPDCVPRRLELLNSSIELLEGRSTPSVIGWGGFGSVSTGGSLAGVQLGDVLDVSLHYYSYGIGNNDVVVSFTHGPTVSLSASASHPPGSGEWQTVGGVPVLRTNSVSFSLKVTEVDQHFDFYFAGAYGYGHTEYYGESGYLTFKEHTPGDEPLPPPPKVKSALDLKAISLSWDPKHGGLSFKYEITGKPLTPEVVRPLSVFWSSGPAITNQSQEIYLSDLPFPTSIGKHRINIPSDLLRYGPDGATHIVAFLDYRRAVIEQNESNNKDAVADVKLTRGPHASGQLSAHTVSVVKQLLREAGEANALITSVQRSPEDQARVMFENLIHGKYIKYKAAGQSVVDVYNALTDGLTQEEIIAQSTSIQSAMLEQIYSVGPTNVSHHCSDPTVLQVIDLAPSSFEGGSRPLFAVAATEAARLHRIAKFLKPGASGEPAFHFEISQV